MRGITIGGVGVGAHMTCITIGGVGVGTPTITGEGIAGIAAGGVDITGALVAPFGQGVFWLTELGRPQGSQASVSDSTDETGPTSRQPSVR